MNNRKGRNTHLGGNSKNASVSDKNEFTQSATAQLSPFPYLSRTGSNENRMDGFSLSPSDFSPSDYLSATTSPSEIQEVPTKASYSIAEIQNLEKLLGEKILQITTRMERAEQQVMTLKQQLFKQGELVKQLQIQNEKQRSEYAETIEKLNKTIEQLTNDNKIMRYKKESTFTRMKEEVYVLKLHLRAARLQLEATEAENNFNYHMTERFQNERNRAYRDINILLDQNRGLKDEKAELLQKIGQLEQQNTSLKQQLSAGQPRNTSLALSPSNNSPMLSMSSSIFHPLPSSPTNVSPTSGLRNDISRILSAIPLGRHKNKSKS